MVNRIIYQPEILERTGLIIPCTQVIICPPQCSTIQILIQDPAIMIWSTWEDSQFIHHTPWLNLCILKGIFLTIQIHSTGACRTFQQTLLQGSTPTITRHSRTLRYRWTTVDHTRIIKAWYTWHPSTTLLLKVEWFHIQMVRPPRSSVTEAGISRSLSRSRLIKLSGRRSLFNKKMPPRWGPTMIWSQYLNLKRTYNLEALLRPPNPLSKHHPPIRPRRPPHST